VQNREHRKQSVLLDSISAK